MAIDAKFLNGLVNTTMQGIYEKVVLKTIARLNFDSTNNLRVTNTPTGTQVVSGTVTATVANATATTVGTCAPIGSSVTASSQAIAQCNFQQSFRRNLVVT